MTYIMSDTLNNMPQNSLDINFDPASFTYSDQEGTIHWGRVCLDLTCVAFIILMFYILFLMIYSWNNIINTWIINVNDVRRIFFNAWLWHWKCNNTARDNLRENKSNVLWKFSLYTRVLVRIGYVDSTMAHDLIT